MMDEISHKGRVVSVGEYVTEVEIVRSSACGECHVKELCTYSDEQKKIVPVPTDALAMYQVGDEVELCMKRSMGMKAVWISYVAPLLIMVAVVLVTSFMSLQELVVGLSAIVAVALYYVAVLCFRDRLNNEFEFYIKS